MIGAGEMGRIIDIRKRPTRRRMRRMAAKSPESKKDLQPLVIHITYEPNTQKLELSTSIEQSENGRKLLSRLLYQMLGNTIFGKPEKRGMIEVPNPASPIIHPGGR